MHAQVLSATIVLQGRAFVASYTGSLEPVGVVIGYDAEGKNIDSVNSHNGTLHVTVEGKTTGFASAKIPMLSPNEEKIIIVNIVPSVTRKESTIISVNVVQAPTIKQLELEGLKKSVVQITAEGEILHYQNQSFWSEDDFSNILKSKDKFMLDEINSFNNSLQKQGIVMVNPKLNSIKKINQPS